MAGAAADTRGRDEALVRAVLAGMDAADHDVLTLSFGRGLSPAEVAVTVGLSARGARSRLKEATARFEARSVAVALASPGWTSCPALERLMQTAAAGAGLDDRQCTLMTEHARSCLLCGRTLASRAVGSALFDTLTSVLSAEPLSAQPGSAAEQPRALWQRSPALAGAAAAGVALITVAAVGVIKLTGNTGPAPVRHPAPSEAPLLPQRTAGPSPLFSPPPSPSPTLSPTPSPTRPRYVAPPIPPPPQQPSPAPRREPSPAPTSPRPSPTKPSPTPPPSPRPTSAPPSSPPASSPPAS